MSTIDGGMSLSDDLLPGAKSIAEFLFGDSRPDTVRRTYYYISDLPPEKRLPVFRIGNQIFGRKSRIRRWIADQEDAGRAN